jgi:hypothetical protein
MDKKKEKGQTILASIFSFSASIEVWGDGARLFFILLCNLLFLYFFKVHYSTLLHLSPIRFHLLEDAGTAGIEPKTVPTSALAVKLSDALTTQLDLIHQLG